MAKIKYESLKDARVKNKLTMQDIADSADISRSYYNRIENGERKAVSLDKAQAIAKILGMTLDEFNFHVNNMEGDK
jgi:transcriptional regulator with XRE-family HTH domain